MAAMTATETWDFLMEGTRTAHVATVRADGRPHLKPVWFELAGAPGDFQVVFTTAAGTVAGAQPAPGRSGGPLRGRPGAAVRVRAHRGQRRAER